MKRKIVVTLEGDFDSPYGTMTEHELDMHPSPVEYPFTKREMICIRGSMLIAVKNLEEFAQ